MGTWSLGLSYGRLAVHFQGDVNVPGDSEQTWLVAAGLAGAFGVILLLGWLVRRRPFEIADWNDAERAAAEWLSRQGCRRVELTSAGSDGGIDVLTSHLAVQVKHRSARVGRPAVQQIVGAALSVDRAPAIVSTSGFTAPATAYADEHDVALIELSLDGSARGLNDPARNLGRHKRGWVGPFRRGQP